MIIETRKIYKCEYCRKLYQRKHHCEYHEKRCYKNPDNDRACFGCLNLTKEETDVYTGMDDWQGEPIYTKRECFYCMAKSEFIYPPKQEHNGNEYEIDNYENNPMPRECNLKKEESIAEDIFP